MEKSTWRTAARVEPTAPSSGATRSGGIPLDATPLDLGAGLVQVSFLVQDLYARVSERHGLTPAQAKLLCIVAEAPRGMSELAQCFGVERAALTGLVDRAERRGLAERTTVPGDRRALCVVPTAAGAQAASAFRAEVAAELDQLVAGLSPHDAEHLRRMLADLITAQRSPRSESRHHISGEGPLGG